MGGQADDGEEHRHQVPLHTLSPGRHQEGGVSEKLSVIMSLLSLSGPAGACQAWTSGEVPRRQGEYCYIIVKNLNDNVISSGLQTKISAVKEIFTGLYSLDKV